MSNAQRYRNKIERAKELERVAAERDRLREGHRLIKRIAEHIRDNAGNSNLVRTKTGNIISWICINAALQEDIDE